MAKNNVQSVSYLLCSQVIEPQIIHKPKNQKSDMTQIYIKQNIHKHRTQNFEELVPSVSPLLKKHIRLGHAGIVDHYVDLSILDFLTKGIKKEWTEAIKNSKTIYKCITANTSVIWQHAAQTTDQLSSPNC